MTRIYLSRIFYNTVVDYKKTSKSLKQSLLNIDDPEEGRNDKWTCSMFSNDGIPKNEFRITRCYRILRGSNAL